MSGQFRRLSFDEIGFHMLDDPIAHCNGQQIDNCGVNFRWRGKRPAFLSVARNNFDDLIGQLLLNPTMSLCFQLGSFRNRIRVPAACAIAHRESAGMVGHFVDQSPVRIC